MSFSQDGSRLLVGSSYESTDYVAVYEWQSGSSTWTRIGDKIPRLVYINRASLSGDGNVVALGDYDSTESGTIWTARVFHYSGGSWQQVGSNIVWPSSESPQSSKVSISSDGKVLAVGARDSSDASGVNATKSGRVRIYQWPSNDLAASDTWTQMGETIEAWKTSEGWSGSEMEPFSRTVYMDAGTLSGDGTSVVVFRDNNDVGDGYVYEWKSSTWSLVGDVIYLGGEASLSNDGNVVAGAYERIYKESGSGAWSRLGSAGWVPRYQVSLSSDGTRVASGNPWESISDNSNVGLVEIQEWDSDAEEWMTMVQITGVAANDYVGWMVSLSGDGSRLAVYSKGAKHTRVFEIGTTCDTSAAPPNAAVGNCPSTLAFGSSCQPECIQNSTADNPTSTCVSGYLKNATCVNNCEVSAPANGGMGNCGDFLADGASCQPECDPGYATSGSTRCNSGYLSSVAYCYTTSCYVFAPANGGMGDCGDVLADGASCQPECDPGYATTGSTTCNSGYLDDAYCAKPCDVLSAPANGGKGDCGDILVSSSYWNDASCTPTCDDGYVLKGGAQRRHATAPVSSMRPSAGRGTPGETRNSARNGRITCSAITSRRNLIVTRRQAACGTRTMVGPGDASIPMTSSMP